MGDDMSERLQGRGAAVNVPDRPGMTTPDPGAMTPQPPGAVTTQPPGAVTTQPPGAVTTQPPGAVTTPTEPAHGGIRHVGVEEELLLVDAATFRPVPVIDDVIGAGRRSIVAASGALLEHEVKREQIEVVSPPLDSYDELLDAVIEGRHAADEAARTAGARAAALATSPIACDSHVVTAPRYDRIRERFGLTMDDQLTCGFHVHVSIDGPDEGVGVLDRIRPWLPILLALSANSPFWQGVDSTFASYRYQAWGRWPSAGAYELFGSADAYAAAIEEMLATGVLLDAGMVYLDARLSSHAPTVEVRVADVCLIAEDAALLAVLIRALVETAAEAWRAGIPPDDISTGILRLACWRASRSGLDDDLMHPVSRTAVPAADAVGALFHHVREHFTTDAEEALVQRGLNGILRRGNGAGLQRAVLSLHRSRAAVVGRAVELTHADHRLT